LNASIGVPEEIGELVVAKGFVEAHFGEIFDEFSLSLLK